MKIFKKLLALFLVSAAAISFTACGKTEKKEEKKMKKWSKVLKRKF